tara:strand:+ start:530 stop:1462 length:933 start_codon:yes stop_codon:yes gene_type:complete
MSAATDSADTTKRQKVIGPSLEWRVTFDQTQGLRTLVEVVGNILTRVNFRFTYDAKREMHFMCIDSIDPQHVCMIQARLICEKTHNLLNQEVDFCVDSNILNLILKNIPSHYSIDMEKFSDSPDISITAYETLSNSHHTKFELPTLVDDSETMQLSDMSYKYTIEIDLGTLRQIVKMSMSLRANQLEFTVKEPADRNSGVSRTTFMIASKGDASQAHCFHSATVAEGADDDTYVIRAATDSTAPESTSDTTRIVYNDAFSAQYLNFFLKSMERQIITMKLSQDKPLIVHYPLGADKSYICFVLAPKTTEA